MHIAYALHVIFVWGLGLLDFCILACLGLLDFCRACSLHVCEYASNSNDQFVRARYNVIFCCRYKKFEALAYFLRTFQLKKIKGAPNI